MLEKRMKGVNQAAQFIAWARMLDILDMFTVFTERFGRLCARRDHRAFRLCRNSVWRRLFHPGFIWPKAQTRSIETRHALAWRVGAWRLAGRSGVGHWLLLIHLVADDDMRADIGHDGMRLMLFVYLMRLMRLVGAHDHGLMMCGMRWGRWLCRWRDSHATYA